MTLLLSPLLSLAKRFYSGSGSFQPNGLDEWIARVSALLVGVCRVGWGSRPRSSRQGALAP